jgi:hypothetical protein
MWIFAYLTGAGLNQKAKMHEKAGENYANDNGGLLSTRHVIYPMEC